MHLDPSLLLTGLAWAGRLLAVLLLWLWLRPALSPAWVARLFESEGKPSIRLVLAAVVVVFCLCMDAAGRLTTPARTAWLGFAEILLALGTVKVVASRFAPKPATDPTEQAGPSPPGPLSGKEGEPTTGNS